MNTDVIRLSDNVHCAVCLDGDRVDSRIRNEILSNLKARFASTCTSTTSIDYARNVLTEMDEFLRERGDKQQLRESFGVDAHGWYLLSCDLVAIWMDSDAARYVLVGTIPAAIVCDEQLTLLPMQNLSWELENQTQSESQLEKFSNRDRNKFLSQVLYNSRSLVKKLAAMPESELLSRFGRVRSRALGFFPKPSQEQWPIYSEKKPGSSTGIVKTGKNCELVFYQPTIEDELVLSRASMEQAIRNRLHGKAAALGGDVSSGLTLGRGQALRINPRTGEYTIYSLS